MNKEEQLSKFDAYLKSVKAQGIENNFYSYLSEDDGCIIGRLMVGKLGFREAKEKIGLFSLRQVNVSDSKEAIKNVDKLIAAEFPEFPEGFVEKASYLHFNDHAKDATIRALLENWT